MYSVFRMLAFSLIVASAGMVWANPPDLWVCADRNNLPYSNDKQQGFENKLAEMVAHDLGRNLHYVWWPASHMLSERIFRNGACDMTMGIASTDHEIAEPTRPYYRSSYVFVSRRDRKLAIDSFDDPALRTVRIGLHVVDDGFTPAAQELASRGIHQNIVAYSVFGNLAQQNPSADLIRGVERGDVDVAIAWGPLAGYFAKHSPVPLAITPICVTSVHTALPIAFEISMGVRRGQKELLQQLNSEIVQRQAQIRELLLSYGVPLGSPDSGAKTCK